jgi:hypothetical protein
MHAYAAMYRRLKSFHAVCFDCTSNQVNGVSVNQSSCISSSAQASVSLCQHSAPVLLCYRYSNVSITRKESAI